MNPTGEFTANEPTGIDLARIALWFTYARELGALAGLGMTRQSIWYNTDYRRAKVQGQGPATLQGALGFPRQGHQQRL